MVVTSSMHHALLGQVAQGLDAEDGMLRCIRTSAHVAGRRVASCPKDFVPEDACINKILMHTVGQGSSRDTE